MQKHAPEAIGVLRVVGRVSFVLIERNRVRDLVGFEVDLHFEIELLHFLLESPVKNRDGLRFERKTSGGAVVALDLERVRNKVEVDLKSPRAVRNRAGGEPRWRYVQCDVPGMIRPRRLRQANLADDLRPQVQRCVGLLPCI